MDSPLRPLLVQNTMPTLLASDLVSSLQRNSRIAVTAQVSDDRTVHGASAEVIVAEGVLDAEGGDLVGFAGHCRDCFGVRRVRREMNFLSVGVGL